MKNPKKPKHKQPDREVHIVERKLGRERAHGMIYWMNDDNTKFVIEIDPTQSAEDYLDTLIHESLHLAFPFLEESVILKGAGDVAKILWAAGFRKTTQ